MRTLTIFHFANDWKTTSIELTKGIFDEYSHSLNSSMFPLRETIDFYSMLRMNINSLLVKGHNLYLWESQWTGERPDHEHRQIYRLIP
jgi:hypothetical protein